MHAATLIVFPLFNGCEKCERFENDISVATEGGSHYSARHGAAAYISRSLRLVTSPSVCDVRNVSSTDNFSSVIVSLNLK